MKRAFIVLTPVLTILLGWLSLGFGYGTKLGHPISTTLFLGGFALFIAGVASFVHIANANSYQSSVNYNLRQVGILAGSFLLSTGIVIFCLRNGWNEFDDNEGSRMLVLIILVYLFASVAWFIFNQFKNGISIFLTTMTAINNCCLAFCLTYMLLLEDNVISPISRTGNSEVVKISKDTIFIGSKRDTTYYQVNGKVLINRKYK